MKRSKWQIVSWGPEGHYCRSKMFRWEAEGRYCHRFCTAIAPFWFFNGTSLNCNNALLVLNWQNEVLLIISWEPQEHYHYSMMFCWDPEGRYHYIHPMVILIATFWFSMEHCWIVIKPFWFSAVDMWDSISFKNWAIWEILYIFITDYNCLLLIISIHQTLEAS